MKIDSEILMFIANSKLKLFNVVYQILKRQLYPYTLALPASLIQLAQLLYFPFQEHLRYIWKNDEISKWINFLLEYFTLMKYAENKSFAIYLVVFYFCVSIVQLTIFLIVIESLLVKGKKSNQVPIQILRITVTLLMSILFEPILRILLGFMACDASSGTFMMIYVQDRSCWDGEYIVHLVVAVLTLIEYMILIIIFAQICIESKEADYNVLAQREGQTYLYYYSFIITSLLSYSILEKPKYSIIIIVAQFGFSYSLFYNINDNTPFYNKKMQRIWSIISGLNFWTQLMTVYSFFLEGQFVSKTIQIWLIGIPLIMAILLKKQIYEVDLMSFCIEKTTNGVELVRRCQYILALADSNENNQRTQILLEGFIEFHKQSCSKSDCAILINNKLKKKHQNIAKYKDKGFIIKELINQLLIDGILLFPTCVTLRISYAYFLLDKLQQQQQALNQLYIAETGDPSFDQQFFIYRYQRIIEEKIQKQYQKNDNSKLNLVTEKIIKLEQLTLSNLMEESAMEYLYFWSQLQEEIPDIAILHEHGQKIIISVDRVEKQFHKILEIDPNNAIIHGIISKFYLLIMNDEKEATQQLFEMIRKQKLKTKLNQVYDDITICSEPLISMSLQVGEKCMILDLNKAACSLLGYSKTDLVNRFLEIILPQSYIDYNQQLIQYFFEQQSLEANQINQFPERMLMLKSKSNYVIPCYSSSQVMNSINGFIMISRLRQEIYCKPRCYLVVDIEGKIQSISSQCCQMLNLTHQAIALKNLYITSYFPELLYNREQYINRQQIISYEPLQNTTSRRSLTEIQVNQIIYSQFVCQLTLIETPYVKQYENLYQIFGYVIRLELFNPEQLQRTLLPKKRKSKKIFKYNIHSKTFYMEVNNVPSFDESNVDRSIIWEEPQQLYLIAKQSNASSKKSSSQKHRHFSENNIQYYGDDIKTMRYLNNKIIEIEEESFDDDSISQERQNEKNEIEEKQLQNQTNSLLVKNRQDLITILKDSTLPQIMAKFVLIINLIFISIMTISFTIFILTNKAISDISNALNLLSTNNLRFSSILQIQSSLQDLRFINFNIIPYIQSTVNGNFEQINRDDLKSGIEDLMRLQNMLQANQFKLNADYSQYQDEFENQLIAMNSIDRDVQYYQVNEVVQQLLSTAISLNSSDLENFSDVLQDFYYYSFNTFNSVAIYSKIPQNYYYYYIYSLTENLNNMQLYLTISQFTLLIISYFAISLFLNKHQNILEEVLCLFLELDEKRVRNYIQEAQRFIRGLTLGENNQVDSDKEDSDNQPEASDRYQIKKVKRKTVHFQTAEKRKTFCSVFFINSLFAFFFFYNFSSINIIISDTNALAPLLNITSYASGFYRLLDNAMNEVFWNSSSVIINQKPLTAINQILEAVYELDSTIHILNQQNVDIVDQNYNIAFNNIYILNPCLFMGANNSNDLEVCETFNDGVLKSGLSIGITKFLESQRYLFLLYNAYNSSQNYQLPYNLSHDPQLQYNYNLLNTESNSNNRRMAKVFIKHCQEYLIDILESTLNSHYNSILIQLITMFICFCAYFVIIYFLWWIPILQKNYKQIQQNRTMLSFISLETIEEIGAIKQYIKTWSKQE